MTICCRNMQIICADAKFEFKYDFRVVDSPYYWTNVHL